MSYKSFEIEQKKLIIQRWFYSLVGVLTMIPIILLTIGQIRYIEKENNEFSIYILFIIHSGFVIYSIILTGLFCHIINALLTTLTIILLSAYTGIHFYIHFMFDHHHQKEDFTVVTIRLGFVLIMLIILLPWTSIMTHSYRMNVKKEIIFSRAITFSWFLNLDSMLIISLLILNIRSQADFGRHQLLILAIGIPLVFLWLIIGKLLIKTYRHWIIWIIFYILAIIQILHLGYIIYWSKYEYDLLLKTNKINLFSLIIIIFICSSINIFIHFLTIIISFCLF